MVKHPSEQQINKFVSLQHSFKWKIGATNQLSFFKCGWLVYHSQAYPERVRELIWLFKSDQAYLVATNSYNLLKRVWAGILEVFCLKYLLVLNVTFDVSLYFLAEIFKTAKWQCIWSSQVKYFFIRNELINIYSKKFNYQATLKQE